MSTQLAEVAPETRKIAEVFDQPVIDAAALVAPIFQAFQDQMTDCIMSVGTEFQKMALAERIEHLNRIKAAAVNLAQQAMAAEDETVCNMLLSQIALFKQSYQLRYRLVVGVHVEKQAAEDQVNELFDNIVRTVRDGRTSRPLADATSNGTSPAGVNGSARRNGMLSKRKPLAS